MNTIKAQGLWQLFRWIVFSHVALYTVAGIIFTTVALIRGISPNEKFLLPFHTGFIGPWIPVDPQSIETRGHAVSGVSTVDAIVFTLATSPLAGASHGLSAWVVTAVGVLLWRAIRKT